MAPSMPSLARAAILVAALVLVARADDHPAHVADPFADPKNDPYNPLHYITTNSLTLTGYLLFDVVANAHFLCMWRTRSWWMSVLVIGELTMSFGFIFRWPLHKYPDSIAWYIMQDLFIVLSPCAFIAADYMILGRLVRHLACEQHLRLVPPHRITRFFVISDIVTFLIQANGGSIAAHPTAITAKIGSYVMLVGLILQLLSFLVFTAIFGIFVYRVRKYEPQVWSRDSAKRWYSDWRTFTVVVAINCLGIIVRSVYRTVEMSEGFSGPLSTTEGYFYGLDTLPLFIAVVVYVPFWPGRFIPAPPKPKAADEEQRDNFELLEPIGRGSSTTGGRSTHDQDASSGDRVLVT
ncbi:RTA1-domain-containing protein [Dentipellis sp. KUC8613]|nr:RTA1-domain-containing protein [Dentipellis sp. KUC8613]